ncbi:MAG: hypothetical protein LBS84_12480 [Clostridiales bacterium]|jgi:hypothetical protein|nr:hypothetical protein [Clostridiales bacterium]
MAQALIERVEVSDYNKVHIIFKFVSPEQFSIFILPEQMSITVIRGTPLILESLYFVMPFWASIEFMCILVHLNNTIPDS